MSKILLEQLHSAPENECSPKSFLIPVKNRFYQAIKKVSLFTTCLVICLLAFNTAAKAQNGISVASIKKDATATEWHLYKQVDGVNIYYQYVDCGPVGNIFFKVKNTTNEERAISWKYQFFQDKRRLESNPDDVIVSFDLRGMTSTKGDCNNSGNKLMVFVREGNSPFQISEIELSNLTVTKAN